jgi:hypothetical protein
MIMAVRALPASVLLSGGAIAVAWIALVLIPMRHDPASFTVLWLVMAVAMMVPTILRPMRRIAGDSAERAIVFLLGYVFIWTLVALPAYLMMQVSWSAPVLGFMWVVVGVNQVMPWTNRALHTCQRLRVQDSVWRSGMRQGMACVLACGPLMVLAMVTIMSLGLPHVLALLGMVTLTLYMVWEKRPAVSTTALHASALVFTVIGVVLWLMSGSVLTHIHV